VRIDGLVVSDILRVGAPAAQVATEARLRGATVGVVGPAAERRALLGAIGRVLRFPAYYGGNLDALEECLGDLSWLPAAEVVLVWAGDEALRRADPWSHRALLDVLTGAVRASAGSVRPLRVVLAEAGAPEA
jgi:Barstar (barnase inhibitor)